MQSAKFNVKYNIEFSTSLLYYKNETRKGGLHYAEYQTYF